MALRADLPLAISAFTADGKDDPALAAQFHQRSTMLMDRGTAADWKASFIQSGISDVVTLDLTRRTDQILQTPLLESLKDVEFKVGGVDVGGIVKNLAKMLTPSPTTITGTLMTYSDSISLTIVLHDPSSSAPDKFWTVTSLANGTLSEPSRKAVVESLIDRSLFKIAVDLRKDRATTDDSQPNTGDELADLHLGRRHLDEYYRTGSDDQLKHALEHFRELAKKRPHYIDGLMLLGAALHENRQAEEAVATFDQIVKRVRPRAAAPGEDQFRFQRQLFDAWFMQGSANLFRYEWDSALAAIADFSNLSAEIGTVLLQKVDNPDHERYCQMMQVRAELEASHAYGHLLAYLRDSSRAQNDKLASSLKLPKGRIAGDSYEMRLKLADACHKKAADIRAKVAPRLEKLDDQWRTDLEAHLSEVSGYADYRQAYWVAPGHDDEYRKKCTQAIQSLKVAEQVRISDYYALLQNLGMIYLDRRYDPSGELLSVAEKYFKKSVALKPSDYYGNEQLATAAARRAAHSGDDERNTAVATGIELMGAAIAARPNCDTCRQTAFVIRLIGLQQFRPQADVHKSKYKALVREFETTSGTGKTARVELLRLFFGAEEIMGTPEAGFLSARVALLAKIEEFKKRHAAGQNESWEAAELIVAAQKLADQLGPLAYADRVGLTQPYEAALPLP